MHMDAWPLSLLHTELGSGLCSGHLDLCAWFLVGPCGCDWLSEMLAMGLWGFHVDAKGMECTVAFVSVGPEAREGKGVSKKQINC